MRLDILKQHWEAFGSEDPLWAVLTESDRRGGRWDLEEFLATGEREVAELIEELDRLAVEVRPGRALDFGCGVGRLTQALAGRFERCDGVDIATSMIAEAERINRRGERVNYHVNDQPNLELFADGTFDFVLSFIVLQHMEPRYAKRYIAEFIRVLKPGGVAVFQVPSPSLVAALPDPAFRASLAVVGKAPKILPAGEDARLRVRVRNASPVTWPADARVRLSSRWRDRNGALMIDNGPRAEPPGELAPGAETTLELTVQAPAFGGSYELELDLVQEEVSWFAGRGSQPLRLGVQVDGGPEVAETTTPGGPAALQPVMEMYSTPPAEVRQTVSTAGGEVLHQLPDQRAGHGTDSYRYVVRRVAARTPPLSGLSLHHLSEAIAAIPSRPDMFPPVITRRTGRVGALEIALRRRVGRALRWLTWVQGEHDRAVLRALDEARVALQEQDGELRRLRAELARLGAEDSAQ